MNDSSTLGPEPRVASCSALDSPLRKIDRSQLPRFWIMLGLVVVWELAKRSCLHWCSWDVERETFSCLGFPESFQSYHQSNPSASFVSFVNERYADLRSVITLSFLGAILVTYGWRNFTASFRDLRVRAIVLYASLCFGVGICIASLLGALNIYSDPVHSSDTMARFPTRLFLAGFLEPIGEEIGCRFLLFQLVRMRYRFIVAALISSVAFGLLHSGYPNSLKMLTTSVTGLMLAFIYERSGSLLTPIAAHCMNNSCFVVWTQFFR
jgi:membrane protease YdiL (CAAX protease family)